MLLIKESGAGISGANTYSLPEDVLPFAQIYNWTTWISTTDSQAKESACARATMFLDLFPNIYEKLTDTQLPRRYGYARSSSSQGAASGWRIGIVKI